MRYHNQKIANSTFPLSTLRQGESTNYLLDRIRKYQADSHTLQGQLTMFKATWEANKGLCPPSNGNFRGYEDGLAQWVDDIIVANDTAVAQATNKIDAHSQRIRQLMIEDDNATASRAYMERARVIGGSAPPSIEGGPVRGGEEAGPDSEPAQGAGDGKGGATAQQ
jgi:hypothetical protein